MYLFYILRATNHRLPVIYRKILILVNTLATIGETSKVKTENVFKVQMECLLLLQKLHQTLEHGVDICQRIVLCYKLAVQIGKSYQFLLLLNNPFQFLQEVAESNVENKSEVLRSILKQTSVCFQKTLN